MSVFVQIFVHVLFVLHACVLLSLHLTGIQEEEPEKRSSEHQ